MHQNGVAKRSRLRYTGNMDMLQDMPIEQDDGFLQLDGLDLPEGEIVNEGHAIPAVDPLCVPVEEDDAPILTPEQEKMEMLVQEILALRRQMAALEQRLTVLERDTTPDE